MQGQSAWWIIGLIVLFLLGSIFGLRVSPRDKALGQLRERARKIGLQPRLVPAPDWIKAALPPDYHDKMVAYYSLIVPQAQFKLMRAINCDQHWHVLEGVSDLEAQSIALKGVYGLDQQANSIGIYWDESADFDGMQLEKLKDYLHSLGSKH